MQFTSWYRVCRLHAYVDRLSTQTTLIRDAEAAVLNLDGKGGLAGWRWL